MSNIVSNLMEQAANAASTNPYVAGGMVAGGVILAIGGWLWNKHKERKAAKK